MLSAYSLLNSRLATPVHHETPQQVAQLRNPPHLCDCDERCEAGEYVCGTSTPEFVYLFALMLITVHSEIAPTSRKIATLTVSTISNSKISSQLWFQHSNHTICGNPHLASPTSGEFFMYLAYITIQLRLLSLKRSWSMRPMSCKVHT